MPVSTQHIFESGNMLWFKANKTLHNVSRRNTTASYMSTVNTGKHYRLSLDLDAGSVTNATLSVMGNGSHVLSTYNFTGITHQQIDFVADGPTITIKVLIGSGSGSRVVYIDNLKLEEIVEGLGRYRFGFNSMEKDDEVKGGGNSYDFGNRIQDPRLGLWLSLDPLQHKYPDWSSYNYSLNSPIAL
jgi:RHS repeat-associated protein